MAFALSALIHAGAYWLGYAAPRIVHPAVELDLTMSGHVGMLGGGHHAAPKAAPAPPAAPKAAEKDWVKSTAAKPAPIATPSASPTPAPAPEPEKPATNANGSDGGFGEGDGDLSSLTRLPALLNLSDLSAILRKFYPEAERDAGREGTVVVDLHVDANGRVTAVEVVRSADPAFDEAAKKAALLLRFSPAYRGAEKVPVKLRQAIKFNLEK